MQSLHDVGNPVLVGLVERGHPLAELMRELQRSDTISAPTPTHVHGDDVDDGQRAFDDSRQFVADRDVLPPLWVCTPTFLGLVLGLNLRELLCGPVLALECP